MAVLRSRLPPPRGPNPIRRLFADNRGMTLTAQYLLDRSRLADRKHNDRHTVFAGKREGRGIHHFEVLLDGFLMAQALIALGGRVAFGVGAIDAVDIGGLEHRVAFELAGAQDRGRVGREMRIAGARRTAPGSGPWPDACARAGWNRIRRPAGRRAPTGCAPARRRARSRLRAQGRSSRSRACPSCRRSGATRRARRLPRRGKYCRRRPRRRSRRQAFAPPTRSAATRSMVA